MSDSFDITYAAHTATCTFLLDSEGICRRIVVDPGSKRALASKGREARSAARCVGAQYVASLDPTVTGMLADMPRVGSPMLFACVDERGRVSLVRTGLVTRFERHTEDPFVETEKAPSMSVQTSAPIIDRVLAPSAPTPRKSRPPAAPPPQDVYEEDASDRTQPIQALRPAALIRDLRRSPSPDHQLGDDDVTLDRTAEYESRPVDRSSATSTPPRTTWPSPGAVPTPPPLPTLRQPPSTIVPPSSDENPYGPRGVLPRRSEPYMARTRSDRGPRPAEPMRTTPRSPGYPVAEKVASGRRGDR